MSNALPCPKCGTRWNAPTPQSNQANAPDAMRLTTEGIFVIRQAAAVLQGILSYSPAGREDLARKLFAIADNSVPDDVAVPPAPDCPGGGR